MVFVLLISVLFERALFQMLPYGTLATAALFSCLYGVSYGSPFPTPMDLFGGLGGGGGGDGFHPNDFGSSSFHLSRVKTNKADKETRKAKTSRLASQDTIQQLAARYGGLASVRSSGIHSHDFQYGNTPYQPMESSNNWDSSYSAPASDFRGMGYPQHADKAQQPQAQKQWYDSVTRQYYDLDIYGNPIVSHGQGSSFGAPDIPLLDDQSSFHTDHAYPYQQGQPTASLSYGDVPYQHDETSGYSSSGPSSFTHNDADTSFANMNLYDTAPYYQNQYHDQSHSGQDYSGQDRYSEAHPASPSHYLNSQMDSGYDPTETLDADTAGIENQLETALTQLPRVKGLYYPVMEELFSPQQIAEWERDYATAPFTSFPPEPRNAAVVFLAKRRDVSGESIFARAAPVMTWRMLRQALSGEEAQVQEVLKGLYGAPSKEWMYNVDPKKRKLVVYRVSKALNLKQPTSGYGYLANRIISAEDGARILEASDRDIKIMSLGWQMNPIRQHLRKERSINRSRVKGGKNKT
jgi:hypothetical protein